MFEKAISNIKRGSNNYNNNKSVTLLAQQIYNEVAHPKKPSMLPPE